LSSDKLKNFWKPIILAARREREFFKLLDKLKPIILDEKYNIEDTVPTSKRRVSSISSNR
jgi:hypothetical protein